MFSITASTSDWCRYLAAQTSLRFVRPEQGMGRAQRVGGETLLLGAYHHTNLGDIALGESVSVYIPGGFSVRVIQKKISHQNQPLVVIGGGSLITSDNIGRLRSAEIDPNRVLALGVDLWPRVASEWSQDDLEYLRNLKRISLRSRRNYNLVLSQHLVTPDRLTWSFDNAFSLFQKSAVKPDVGRVGINMMPHLFQLKGRTFYPGSAFGRRRFGSNEIAAATNYISVFQTAVRQLNREGKTVAHIPFTVEDDLFARTALDGLDVDFLPYRPFVREVLGSLSQLEMFIGTRYHAFVFSIALGVPYIGVAYAGKCENLASDVGMPKGALLSDSDIVARGTDELGLRISNALESPFSLNVSARHEIFEQVRKHLSTELSALHANLARGPT